MLILERAHTRNGQKRSLPASDLPSAKLRWICSFAGYHLAGGGKADLLVPLLPDDPAFKTDAREIAMLLFPGLSKLPARDRPALHRFLRGIEKKTHVQKLEVQIMQELKRLMEEGRTVTFLE